MITLISSFLFGGLPAFSGQAEKAEPAGRKGYLEIECNIIGVDLHLCPLAQFERQTTRWFFGLLTSYQEICTGKKLFLGTTPLGQIELPAGSYVLLIPQDYAWEHEGPIEVSIAAGQKTFFLLSFLSDIRAMKAPVITAVRQVESEGADPAPAVPRARLRLRKLQG